MRCLSTRAAISPRRAGPNSDPIYAGSTSLRFQPAGIRSTLTSTRQPNVPPASKNEFRDTPRCRRLRVSVTFRVKVTSMTYRSGDPVCRREHDPGAVRQSLHCMPLACQTFQLGPLCRRQRDDNRRLANRSFPRFSCRMIAGTSGLRRWASELAKIRTGCERSRSIETGSRFWT